MALNGVQEATSVPSGNGATATAAGNKQKSKLTSGHNLNSLLYLMYARHNFLFCKAIIEQCMAAGCDLEYPYFVKGLICRHEGSPSEAIKCFQKAVELNSTNPEYYREIAKTLYEIGRYKQSLEIFIRAETLLKRSDCESHYYIAKLLARNVSHGQLKRQDAKEYFMKAIQSGRHLDSMHELAEIYVREGDLRKSIDLLENSLQINCDDVNVLTRIGILHLMAGEAQTAFTRLLDALIIDGSSPKLILALGGQLQARGDTDGALNKYKSITDWDGPAAVELWSNLGLCFMRNQKLISAISCLRKALVMTPLNFNVLFNLGYVFMKANLYVSAFHTLATALNLKPNHTEGIMLLAICLSELNDKRNAASAFEKAANMPDVEKYPLALLNFAIFSHQNHNYGPSWRSLDRYMALVDNHKTRNESNGTVRNHLKVARKLMCLLKLIYNGTEEGEEEGMADDGDGSVIAAQVDSGRDRGDRNADEADDCPNSVVEGPSLVVAVERADDEVDNDNDVEEDSLEATGNENGEGYEFLTVVAEVRRED